MPNVETIGDYAFFGASKLEATPSLAKVSSIGNFAFAFTRIKAVVIPDDTDPAENDTIDVGAYAFAYNEYLQSVTIGNDIEMGEAAFYCPVNMGTYDQTGSIQ